MSNKDNPYGGGYGGQLTGNVSFGGNDAAADPLATPAPSSSGPLVTDTTTANFNKDVIEASRSQPVLIDFWAPWCGPCKQLTPALEKAVTEAGGRVRLVKMNIDDHPAIPGQLGIQSIPAVLAFKDGQPVDGFMGAVPESQIKEFIDRIAGPDTGPQDALAEALAQADEASAQGDIQTAAEIYSAVLQRDEGNAAALAGMAGIYLDSGDMEHARAMLDLVPEDKTDDAAVASVRARIALAEEASSLGDRAPLLARLEADSGDHDARMDLAKIENAAGDRDAAANHLLDIIQQSRDWNEGAAKEQLLQFFEAWGIEDPATLAARRRLSSLLFS